MKLPVAGVSAGADMPPSSGTAVHGEGKKKKVPGKSILSFACLSHAVGFSRRESGKTTGCGDRTAHIMKHRLLHAQKPAPGVSQALPPQKYWHKRQRCKQLSSSHKSHKIKPEKIKTNANNLV